MYISQTRVDNTFVERRLFVFAASFSQELDAKELVDVECRGGNVTFVKEKMEEFGVDAVINASNMYRLTCLHLAAERNRSAVGSNMTETTH